MVSRKYVADYRLEEVLDSNGRTRTKAVYKGGDYQIAPGFSLNEKRLILCLHVLSLLSYFAALIPASQALKLTYVIMPFALSAVPVCYGVSAAISLYRAKANLKRAQAERTANRLPASALVTMILTGSAFLGFAITAAISRDSLLAGDVIFGVLSLIITCAAAVILFKCKGINAVVIEQ